MPAWVEVWNDAVNCSVKLLFPQWVLICQAIVWAEQMGRTSNSMQQKQIEDHYI